MKSLFGHLLKTYLVVALVPLAALAVLLSVDLERREQAALRQQLLAQARRVRDLTGQQGVVPSRALLQRIAQEEGVRITVIRRDGVVLADTHEDPARMANHADRPEIRQAFLTGAGEATRASPTLRMNMLYVAVAADTAGERWGVVRVSLPLQGVQERALQWRAFILGAVLLAALWALWIAARQARRLAEPLDAFRQAARRAGEKGWTWVPRPAGPRELVELTDSFNDMLVRLEALIAEQAAGRAQLETILTQMPDGLLVLDPQGRIARYNQAAARLLCLESDARGRPLIEAATCYPLDAIAREALAGKQPEPVELRAPWPPHPALRLLAVPLPGSPGTAGASILIQELTEVRRADEMRRDFVANVSHELRTPIASLVALAETLLLRGQRRPEIVPEYTERIAQQAGRLAALTTDLLRLSEIESGRRPVHLEPVHVPPLLAEICEAFRSAAQVKSLRLTADAPAGLWVRADRSGLQQALGNLVDNAIKYTPEGGSVRVTAAAQNGQVRFIVADTGIGIEPDALPRVFERFYRVDRGRSREEGGTGLGLAIVKHEVEAQGGRVWAESEVGVGSQFYLALPETPAPDAAAALDEHRE
ncbi:MAG: PAS domain-containing protein [Armatimonadetes bacterium]|nr:PAS domain-containing protein [Armatimonadota bacterium]